MVNEDIIKTVAYEYGSGELPVKITTTVGTGSNAIITENFYSYDDKGNIISMTENGVTYAFEYDSRYNMLTEKSYNKDAYTSIKEEYVLTSDGYQVAQKNVYVNGSLYERTEYQYDSFGNVTSLMLKGSAVSEDNNPAADITTTMTYTSNGRLASQTRAGVTQSYTYDTMGRMLSETDGNGNTTSYEYDSLGRVVKTINPDGSQILTSYDISKQKNDIIVTNETGVVTRYVYDKLGNISEVYLNNVLKESYTYDSVMRVASQTDANGTTYVFAYDYADRVLTKGYEDENGETVITEQYSYVDNYDSQTSKITKTIVGDSNAPSIVTTSFFDKYGNLVKEGIFANGIEQFTTYTYDMFGNKLTELTSYDAQNGRDYTNKYDYDYAGRLVKITNTEGREYLTSYDCYGRKVSETDPKGSTKEYTYDSFGRVVREEIPFEGDYVTVKQYVYDNNGNVTVQSVTNNLPGESESLAGTTYSYDNRNNLIDVYSFDNGNVANHVEYQYNAAGQQTSMISGGNRVTSYTYDSFGNLSMLTDPMGYTETYTYRADGNISTKTDKNGNTFTYSYDMLGRVTSIAVRNIEDELLPESVSYTYTATGAKRSESNQNITITYRYNSDGKISSELSSTGTNKYYFYDTRGNVSAYCLSTDDYSVGTSYTYDSMNRLYQVYDNGNLAATYTYDENGNRSTLTYANGVTTVYSYNKANLVTSLTNVKGDTLSSYSYTYYLDGNQATKTDNAGRVTTYQYDDMGRLTQESGGGVTKSYTFDSAGNRSGMTVTGTENYSVSYTYDLNNRLTKETKAYSDITLESLYTYDNNGNQVSKTEGSNVYTNIYNGFGQLTSSSKNSETIGAYSYRPDGLRMSKTVDGETTQFVWNGSDLFAELNVDGEIVNRYVYGTDLIKSSETSEYYLYNAHGDVVQLTNGFGQVTKTYEYDAFGNEVNPDENDTNPFRYCGEYFDKETGTIYLRARYYDPQTGRFSSEDPIRDGLNWYTYCGGNPVGFVDPSGMIIEVVGTKLEKNDIIYNLNKITDHTLKYDKNGVVYVAEYADSIVHKSGTTLINNLIESKNVCRIRYWDDSSCAVISISSKKVEVDVYIDRYSMPNVYILDLTTGCVVGREKVKNYIAFAHELIHADRAMRGYFVDYGKKSLYIYNTLIHDNALLQNELLIGNKISTHPIIKLNVQIRQQEELETVGLVRAYSGYYITENSIRAEHNLNLRGKC